MSLKEKLLSFNCPAGATSSGRSPRRCVDSCDAFIVVISENAYESEWVQNEVAQAKRRGKSFFPLLLQGEPWLSVESTQYVNVTNSSLPPEKFYKRLEKVTPKTKKVQEIEAKTI